MQKHHILMKGRHLGTKDDVTTTYGATKRASALSASASGVVFVAINLKIGRKHLTQASLTQELEYLGKGAAILAALVKQSCNNTGTRQT